MQNRDDQMNRRSFLRGSSFFAAAVLATPLVALAQQKPEQEKKQEEEKEENPPEKDASGKEILRDANGREYRICPQCGYNMYKQGRMWVCDNCGYSYVE